MADKIDWFSGGLVGVQQQLGQIAFENEQIAKRNDVLNRTAELGIAQKQLELENEQESQRVWKKLQGDSQTVTPMEDLKQIAQKVGEDVKHVNTLREMAKAAPTPEKSIAYAKAADEAEKTAASTQDTQLSTAKKQLEITAGFATGALQADTQQAYDYYKAAAIQNNVALPKGLTGDWSIDKPVISSIANQITQQKDLVDIKIKQARLDQEASNAKDLKEYRNKSLAVQRSAEALRRDRLNFDMTRPGEATKSPKIAMQKELNIVHNQYRTTYLNLLKDRDRVDPKNVEGKNEIARRINMVNNLYRQQKTAVMSAYGVADKIDNAPPKTAEEYFNN